MPLFAEHRERLINSCSAADNVLYLYIESNSFGHSRTNTHSPSLLSGVLHADSVQNLKEEKKNAHHAQGNRSDSMQYIAMSLCVCFFFVRINFCSKSNKVNCLSNNYQGCLEKEMKKNRSFVFSHLWTLAINIRSTTIIMNKDFIRNFFDVSIQKFEVSTKIVFII